MWVCKGTKDFDRQEGSSGRGRQGDGGRHPCLKGCTVFSACLLQPEYLFLLAAQWILCQPDHCS